MIDTLLLRHSLHFTPLHYTFTQLHYSLRSGALSPDTKRKGYEADKLTFIHRPELWRQQTWLLHHDNAPSHNSVLTHQFLAKHKIALTPHPPHFPYLSPCDFFQFPKMKVKLKGCRFDTIEEIQAESQRVPDTLTEKDFQEAFQKLKRRCERCLHAGGNYFEDDGSR
jgi:hypothetical protein